MANTFLKFTEGDVVDFMGKKNKSGATTKAKGQVVVLRGWQDDSEVDQQKSRQYYVRYLDQPASNQFTVVEHLLWYVSSLMMSSLPSTSLNNVAPFHFPYRTTPH